MTESLSQVTKWLLRKHRLRIRKYLGQNFLVDETALIKIIESLDLSGDDFVLEIGAGLGTLTKEVARRVKKVIAIELDQHLINILRENLRNFENVEIIKGDVLKIELRSLLRENRIIKIVANLPYYITTPIIMHLLEQKFPPFTTIVIMVQKEVGLRIVASPDSRDYGVFSVILQYYTEPELISIISRKAFFPSPEVDSAIIKLKIREKPPVKVINEDLFFRLVKASFSHRRKNIANSLLKSQLGLDKAEIAKLLNNARIDPGLRAESLSLDNFACLSNVFFGEEK